MQLVLHMERHNMKVIDETGFVHFRGDPQDAKHFFGNGTLVNNVYEDEVLVTTEVFNLTIEYEATNIEHRLYLTDTDWYLTRKLETGVEIPADVTALRQSAREAIV